MEMSLASGATLTRENRSTDVEQAVDEVLLVERAQQGNENAYSKLVKRYHNRLFNFVRSMVRNDELAEDITQESFVKAYFNLSKLNNPESFKSWLFRIANNNTLDWLRKKRFQMVDVDEHIRESYIDDRTSPEDSAIEDDRVRHIHAALNKLKPEQKAILVMCDLQGLSYHEIAEILKVPFGTVQSRIFYARKKLKEHLDTSIIFGGQE
jgi:RNA polymerase sigma-70 factor (ECF subfamily)